MLAFGEFVAGSLFDSVPKGAAVYLLKGVLHNWDDVRAPAILRQCAGPIDATMTPHTDPRLSRT